MYSVWERRWVAELGKIVKLDLRLALLLPLAGCSALAQDTSNAAMANTYEVVLDNFIADLGPSLAVDDKLKAMGPDGWHRIALYANWDFTEEAVWKWIVSQSDCDRATALTIFWKASPDYYFQYQNRASVPGDDRSGYDLVASIRERWLAGGYKRGELAFDLSEDFVPVDFADLERRYGARVATLMPVSMRGPLPGRRIANVGDPLPGVYDFDPSGNRM